MSKRGFDTWFRKVLTIPLLIVTYASGSTPVDEARAAELAKWRALIPTIESILTRQGSSCPGERMRVSIVDAADLAGRDVALADFCPGGAYTDWIVAMHLEGASRFSLVFAKPSTKSTWDSPKVHP